MCHCRMNCDINFRSIVGFELLLLELYRVRSLKYHIAIVVNWGSLELGFL